MEKCLKKEGIPYVVIGREEFLEEKAVRGTICFFRSILDENDGFSRKTALKLLWNLSEDMVSDSVYEVMAKKYSKGIKKEKPQKILEKWMEDLSMGDDEGLEKLVSMAIFHKNKIGRASCRERVSVRV